MVAPWFGSEVGDADDDAVTRFEPRFAPDAPHPAYVIPSPLPLPPQQRIPMTAPVAIDPARLYYTGSTDAYLRVDTLPRSALDEPPLSRAALACAWAAILAIAIPAGVAVGYLAAYS